MADEPKIITDDDRLKAFALTVLANEYSLKAYEAEAALKKLLGYEEESWGDYGHISDQLYSSERTTSATFDEALRRAKIAVASNG